MRLLLAVIVALCSGTSVLWAEEEDSVSIDFAFQQYLLPDENDLSIPVFTLNWDSFSLEARYNYESRDAASVWLAKTFEFEHAIDWSITPMAGVVMGSIHGMAPGLKLDMSWQRLNLYSEMEYVFDFEDRENNFFYSWSELTLGVYEGLRVGVVGNRTKAYDTAVELDRGPIVAYDFDAMTLSATALNVDSNAVYILGLSFSLEVDACCRKYAA